MVAENSRGGNYVPLLIALVCLVAIGLSGATLTSADTSMVPNIAQGPDFGEGGGTQDDGTTSDRDASGAIGSGEERYTEFTRCIDFLTSPLVVIGIVALYALSLAGVAKQFSAAASVLVGLTLVPPLAVGYFFLTNCQGGSVIGPGGGGGAGGVARGLGASSPVPAWMLIPLVLGLVAVGAAVLVFGSNDVEEFETTEEDDDEPDAAVDDVAAAAGAAADRIDTEADVDNEVFEAWREMTNHLDIPNPESSTTGEFAHAAIAAGMDRDDVLALKGLFDEVRYGQAEPSTDREERAVSVLRDIESTYSDSTASDDEHADGAGDAPPDADDATNDADAAGGTDGDDAEGSPDGGDGR